MVKVGLLSTVYMVTSNAFIHFATPSQQHGCMMGFHSYIFFGTTVPGALLAGWLAQVGGTTLAFAVAGAVGLLEASVGLLWYLRWPALRGVRL